MKSDLRVVIGLGVTGLSCVRYLMRQGVAVAVNDSRVEPPCLAEARREFPELEIATGEFSVELINKASELIVSPGVALDHPLFIAAQARGVPIIGDVELFVRAAKAPIVAITGSNGKSTVTTVVGLMAEHAGLKVQVGGNLGTPVLDFLNEAEPDYYVLELSSFQLDTTYSLKAAASVVLNVSPDHLDRYPSFSAYLKSKQHIYTGTEVAVLNVDEPEVWQNLNFDHTPLGFSVNPSLVRPALFKESKNLFKLIQDQGKFYLVQGEEKLLAVEAMKLKGRHNWQNALAALALGTAINLPIKAMLEVLQAFPGLAHRCQWVANIKGVDWYNDSKGTNVGASQSAIISLGELLQARKIILIAGGQGKDADFTILKPELKKYVKQVILLGIDAPILEQAWKEIVPVLRVDSLQAAVIAAAELAVAGDNVLLSPACASLDMFKNYEDRGEQFVRIVTAQRFKGKHNEAVS